MDKYKVVSTNDFGKFERECNGLLSKGYKPIGGVSTVFVPLSNSMFYTQAFFWEGKKY